MLSERKDQCMNPRAVPTLEKNHFWRYQQLLSCILAFTSPKSSKSKSLFIYSTLINKFTNPTDVNVSDKSKLLLSNPKPNSKFRTITTKLLQMNICYWRLPISSKHWKFLLKMLYLELVPFYICWCAFRLPPQQTLFVPLLYSTIGPSQFSLTMTPRGNCCYPIDR